MSKLIDLTGKRFGKWTVLRKDAVNKQTKWICKCDCGTIRSVQSQTLRIGGSMKCFSCRTIHGLSGHKLYDIHRQIVRRCLNPKSSDYARYGGRGISICDEWLDLKVFVSWCVDNGWKHGLEIDRDDNDKDYNPSNCHFVTRLENVRNRSNTARIELNGVIKPVAEWAEVTGIRYFTIMNRINKLGWTAEQALTTPAGGKR